MARQKKQEEIELPWANKGVKLEEVKYRRCEKEGKRRKCKTVFEASGEDEERWEIR